MPLGKNSLGVAFFAFMLFASIMDLARASILALEMAALIVLSISLPCRLAPRISLIIAGGSLEVMVYRVRVLNAKASGLVP